MLVRRTAPVAPEPDPTPPGGHAHHRREDAGEGCRADPVRLQRRYSPHEWVPAHTDRGLPRCALAYHAQTSGQRRIEVFVLLMPLLPVQGLALLLLRSHASRLLLS